MNMIYSPLSFFPMPQEDELLDSVIYRYHWLSGNARPEDTLRTLFGLPFKAFPRLLSGRLDHFLSVLPGFQKQGATDLLRRYSLLPALARHFTRQEVQDAISESRESRALGTSQIYLHGSREVIHRDFRCCPMCVSDELGTLGFAYWHRSHQLHGVEACHNHGCDLISHCPHCGTPIHKKNTAGLPQKTCGSCGKPLMASFTPGVARKRLSILAHQALRTPLTGTDQVKLLTVVNEKVGDDTASFCKEVEARCGADYLPAVRGYNGDDWLRYSIRPIHQHCTGGPWHLRIWSFAYTLALVDTLFGSWESLDRELNRQERIAAKLRKRRNSERPLSGLQGDIPRREYLSDQQPFKMVNFGVVG